MTKEEERQYRQICEMMSAGLFSSAANLAGRAVIQKVSYRIACDAIYAACYQGLFASALKKLQIEGTVANGLSFGDAWTNRAVHELVAHEIVRKMISYLDTLDDRYTWVVNILKKKKPY